MQAVGQAAHDEIGVYFTGGATAVLVGWRAATIAVDILVVPESDTLLRALPRIKDELSINVELASPLDFIPCRPGGRRVVLPSVVSAAPRSSISIHTRRRSRRSSAAISKTGRMWPRWSSTGSSIPARPRVFRRDRAGAVPVSRARPGRVSIPR
jgi:hypothetical protein